MYTHWRTQIGPRLNAPNMMVLDSLQDSEISSSSVGVFILCLQQYLLVYFGVCSLHNRRQSYRSYRLVYIAVFQT